jgi:hypothetical protein
VIAANAASLARAPNSPVNFTAVGNAVNGVRVSFTPSLGGGEIDHFVVAARPVTENLYQTRLRFQNVNPNQLITPQSLGLTSGQAFFISAASVDEDGHESLFAFPEVRCDSTGCAAPAGAASATAPVKASERVFKDVDDE